MEKKRTLLVTSQYAPELGGVPRLLWSFTQNQTQKDGLYILSVQQQPQLYADFDQQMAYPIERVAQQDKAGFTSVVFHKRLQQIARSWRPDVILSGVAYPTAIMARMCHLFQRIPYVVYAHSEDVTIQNRHKRRLLRWALRGAQTVITVSQFTRNELIQLGVAPDNICIIPPGIETDPFVTAKPRNDWSGKWVLLTVARLIARKGQDTVIRALPQVLKQIPNAHYVVVGGGIEEEYLRQLTAELNLSKHVTFAGRVSDEDLPAYYQTCDAFAMITRPSQDEVEGFGITFLEAGAAGKPVIGGQAGGVADAIVDGLTGLLVDPLSVEEVAKTIVCLAQDSALAQQLGQAGYEHVMKNHTAAVFAESVTAVLQKAVNWRVQPERQDSVSGLQTQ